AVRIGALQNAIGGGIHPERVFVGGDGPDAVEQAENEEDERHDPEEDRHDQRKYPNHLRPQAHRRALPHASHLRYQSGDPTIGTLARRNSWLLLGIIAAVVTFLTNAYARTVSP